MWCSLIPRLLGQTTLPDPAEILKVSVVPWTDSVTIVWKPSTTAGIDGYTVYEKDKISRGSSQPGDSILVNTLPSTTDTTFYYPRVNLKPIPFIVLAYKNKVHSQNNIYPPHKTIFLKLNNDSCNAQINLIWTNYVGWGTNLDHYIVLQKIDGAAPSNLGTFSPSDTTLTVKVDPNKTYCYCVCAYHKDGSTTSYSNDSCIFTRTSRPPDFINANYASFPANGQNPVKLKFTLDPNSELKNYQLFTSNDPGAGFVTDSSIITATSDSIVLTDLITGNSPKYYKLEVLNTCNRPTVVSNLATAMILKGAAQGNQVNLIWTAYQGWPVLQYNIYRSIGGVQPVLINSVTTNEYSDNISSLIGQQNPGDFCYYIEAVSNTGESYRSFSSNYCVDLSGAVFVPNAFTPDGNGINEYFTPSFAFIPASFSMVIYNRYGFKIFETKDFSKGWDGTFGNGTKAPEGAYVYFIKFTTQSGKTFERNGNFSLIYP